MELPSYFTDFLADIRPTEEHQSSCQKGHKELRELLTKDETLGPIIVSTFLQGSYRRSTAVQPVDGNLDVDVVVVTRLKESEFTPAQALNKFLPFVKKHYGDSYEMQGRSIGLHLEDVDLDLVITSAPSEEQEGLLESRGVSADDTLDETEDWPLVKSLVEARSGEALFFRSLGRVELLEKAIKSQEKPQWKLEPLRIPDRDAKEWRDTHPLAQMEWTWEKNAQCNTHYINVVKALKWWRSTMKPLPKYPKGYPIEHLIGYCCPNNITSVAQGITETLENITTYYSAYASANMTPSLSDHGVNHDVLARVSGENFAAFYAHVSEAATLARQALDAQELLPSARAWHQLLGDKFPEPPGGWGSDESGGGSDGPKTGGFTERSHISSVSRGRFGIDGTRDRRFA